MTQTVLFVCRHGAATSRVAAAFFDELAPPDWHAVSAGLEPDRVLSPAAARLLRGTTAAAHLDGAPPRPVVDVRGARRIVGIDCAPTGATDLWTLRHREFDTAMRDEIYALVVEFAAEVRDG